MQIYVIRHGETNSNLTGKFQGWLDDVLNENGIGLAELTGKGMTGIKFDAAFSSPLKRAYDTTRIVLRESGNGDLPIATDRRLMELNLGDLEGKIIRGPECEVDPGMIRIYFSTPGVLGRFPGGESIDDLKKRTQEFIKELAQKDYGRVLVGTHGCAVRAMMNFLYDNPADFWHGRVPYNCAVTIVEGDGRGLKLVGDDVLYYDRSLIVDRYPMK